MAKSNNGIKARRKWTPGDIVVHIILAILSVIWVLPIAWIIMISFRGEKGQYVSTLLPKSLTLANYTKLFTDTGILNFMLCSVTPVMPHFQGRVQVQLQPVDTHS